MSNVVELQKKREDGIKIDGKFYPVHLPKSLYVLFAGIEQDKDTDKDEEKDVKESLDEKEIMITEAINLAFGEDAAKEILAESDFDFALQIFGVIAGFIGDRTKGLNERIQKKFKPVAADDNGNVPGNGQDSS